NRFETVQEAASLFQIIVDGLLREVVEFVVIAFVTQDGSIDWAGAHRVFPLLVQQVVQRFAPCFEIGRLINGSGHGGRKQYGDGQQADQKSHWGSKRKSR